MPGGSFVAGQVPTLAQVNAWLTGPLVAADIDSNAITQAKMADDSVGTAELINANVTAAKLAVMPAARAYNSADASISHNTSTILLLDSEIIDTDTIHSTVTNTGRLTCKTAGKYFIAANVRWQANATGQRQIIIQLNGTTNICMNTVIPGTATVIDHTVSTFYDLAVNDYLEVVVYQDSGISLNSIATTLATPHFMMHRLGA